eukprot:1103089-Pelagomonas_calceolata.AAC.2
MVQLSPLVDEIVDSFEWCNPGDKIVDFPWVPCPEGAARIRPFKSMPFKYTQNRFDVFEAGHFSQSKKDGG